MSLSTPFVTAGLVALFACPAAAQQRGDIGSPVISTTETGTREVQPGKAATIVFSIASQTDLPVSYRTAIILPAGWRLLSGSEPLTLGARARETRLVFVAVPTLAIAGRQAIELRLSGERDSTRPAARAVAVVAVAAKPRVELVAVEAPQFVVAGDQYHAAFLLKNSGNAGVAVRLVARSHPAFPATIDSIPFLRPGEQRTVRVTVSTRGIDPSSVTHTLDVEALVGSANDLVAKAQTSVLVVTRAADGGDGYTIPGQMRIIAGGRANSTRSLGAAVELSGKGALSDGGATRIDFLARRSRYAQLPFALRDEYRFNLENPHYALRLGQQLMAISPLLREGRTGSGASGWLKAGALTVGGFHSDDRWDPVKAMARITHRAPEEGGFAELRPIRALTVGVGYLASSSTSLVSAESDRHQLWAARLRLEPISLLRVSAESGYGLGADAGQHGSMITASGDSRYLAYYFLREKSDTGFAGTRPGTTGSVAQVALRPLRRLQLAGSSRDFDFSVQSLVDGARTSGSSREIKGSVSIPGLAAIEYKSLERDFAAVGLRRSDVTGVQQTASIRLTPRLGFASFEARMERGVLREKAGSKRPVESSTLQSTIEGPGRSLTLFVRRDAGPFGFAAVDQSRWSEGISSALRTRSGIFLEMYAVRVQDSTTVGSLISSTIDASLGFTAKSGYGAVFRWRALYNAAPVYPEMQLTLTIPLGVPGRRAGNAGRITGRVYDIETGRGVANALVRVGDKAVLTDQRGGLVIGGLRPDIYNVELDPSSVGGRVALAGATAAVSARAGKTIRIELGVGRSSRVDGRVRLYAPADALQWDGSIEQTHDVSGVAGLLVRLTDGKQTIRRVTNGDGEFEVTDLSPGRWTASLSAADIPAQHYLAAESVVTMVVAGETAKVEFRVLPRKRTLRMVGGGDVRAKSGVGADPQQFRVPTPRSVYSIQLAYCQLRSEADRLVVHFQRLHVGVSVLGDAAPFRVVVGRYLSVRDADKALLRMRKQGKLDGVVIRIPDR